MPTFYADYANIGAPIACAVWLRNLTEHAPVSNTAVWVLIASDNDAAIWTSDKGTSRLVRVVRQHGNESTRGAFAWQLMGELIQGAEAKVCDGVILIAGEHMLKEIRRVVAPEIKRMLLAEIEGAPATLSAVPKEPVMMTQWGTVQ